VQRDTRSREVAMRANGRTAWILTTWKVKTAGSRAAQGPERRRPRRLSRERPRSRAGGSGQISCEGIEGCRTAGVLAGWDGGVSPPSLPRERRERNALVPAGGTPAVPRPHTRGADCDDRSTSAQITRHHGAARIPGASHSIRSPACNKRPARDFRPYSSRKERRCFASLW